MRDRTQEASRQCGKGADPEGSPGGHCQGTPRYSASLIIWKEKVVLLVLFGLVSITVYLF